MYGIVIHTNYKTSNEEDDIELDIPFLCMLKGSCQKYIDYLLLLKHKKNCLEDVELVRRIDSVKGLMIRLNVK